MTSFVAVEEEPLDDDAVFVKSHATARVIGQLEVGQSVTDLRARWMARRQTHSTGVTERGFPTQDYDPFFAPDRGLLDGHYDFVTCSETVEHFHDPAAEFERLHRLVRPGGWIGVMTQRVDERLSPSWGYLRDPTHVCFYSIATMRWIASRFGWTVEVPTSDVVLFRSRRV